MSKKSERSENLNSDMEYIADQISLSANNLSEFQNVVEQVYEKIAFNLPEIDSVIKQNDREARSMLGMISSGQNGSNIKQKTDGMVVKAKQSIIYFAKQIQAMKQREQDLTKLVKQELKSVDSMKTTLGEIQIVLSDIEATTTGTLEAADKTGNAGKSFRYLVKEVIKISNQSKFIVKNIMKLWAQLGVKTNLFFQIEQGITPLSQQDMKDLYNSLQKTFVDSTKKLQQLTLSLKDTVTKGENVEMAIMSVMEAMQNQDIIKQCMDNIIVSLNETNYYARKQDIEDINFAELPEGEQKQIHDEFSFQEEVPNLCKELLGNVEDQLQESNQTLESNFSILNSAIGNNGNSKENKKSSKKQEKSEQGDLSETLSKARDNIDNWFKNFTSSVTEKERLLVISNHISVLFDKIEKQLLFLRNVTFRFRLIVILSKTELMKTTIFSDHKIAQKLNDLTRKIDILIRQSDKQTKNIVRVIRQFVVSFGNNLNESSIKSSVFADEMNTCLENFSDYKGEISRTLENIDACSKKLGSLFTGFSQGVQQIEDQIKKNSKVKETFKDVSHRVHLIRQDLHGDQFEGWQISDERLLSIINKFTVFSHKKIADEMFDLGLEEGDSGGDLTLF